MPTCLLALLQAAIVATEVPVLDLSRPFPRETIELHLPTDVRVIEDFWPNPVAGWILHSPRRERASLDWALGRAAFVRAVHAQTGMEVEWRLPAISQEERKAWDERWERDRSRVFNGVGIEASLTAPTHGEGLLLLDTRRGRRRALCLGFDGSVREDPQLLPGPRWHRTGQSSEFVTGAHSHGVVLSTPRGDLRELQQASDLTVTPRWGPELIQDGRLHDRVSSEAVYGRGAWTLQIKTTISWPMRVPGSRGPYSGPTQRVLSRVAVPSGELLASSVIEESTPLQSVLDGSYPALWSRGDEVVGLTSCQDSALALAHGMWTFAIARPAEHRSDRELHGWAVRIVTVDGPRASFPPRLLGEIEPGLMLYRSWFREPRDKDAESQAIWLAVRG